MFPYHDSIATSDTQIFHANAAASGVGWHVWHKRPGVSMVSFFLLAGGGGGGNGVVGAASNAGGGGGGGSSGQTTLIIPACLIPDRLFISVGYGGAAVSNGIISRIHLTPGTTAMDCLVVTNSGFAGTSGAGAGGGGGGNGGGAIVISNTMDMGGAGLASFIGGSNGAAGGGTGVGTLVAQPTSGLRVTGGSGGGGLPAAATIGSLGGAITVQGTFPLQPGGIGGTGATVPGGNGSNGYSAMPGCLYGFFYGGTGAGSTHGSATGAGLVGGHGGAGSYGCGGGGGGGALTASTQGLGGRGGDGIAIITQW